MGLPVTTIALLLPAVHLAYDRGAFKSKLIYIILLIFVMVGFVSPFEIKKPNIVGKIILVILGALEVFGILFLIGWDTV